MLDPTFSREELTDFSGAVLLPEETDVVRLGALLAKNVQFKPGQVATRLGHSSAFNPNEPITALYNWVLSDTSGVKNYLFWYSSSYGGIRYADMSVLTPTNLYTVSAYAATFLEAGTRLYIAHFDTSGVGAGHGRVHGFGVGEDTLFARPMLTSEMTVTVAEPAAGSVTAGARRVAFIMTTRNGYTQPPSPVNSSMVLQYSTFTSAGAKNLRVTLTPTTTWPTWAKTVQVVMTTVSNLARWYFVRNATATVTPGSSTPAVITLDISDEDLAQTSIEATDYTFLLTQDASNNAPFSPSVVAGFGNRAAYIFSGNATYGQGIFFSDPNNYQGLSADRNLVYLPGQRRVITGCESGGVFYSFGPTWTYAHADSGDFPSSWPSPQLIDGTHGTLSPRGVAMNATQGFMWVACRDGLYRFNGSAYDPLPASYLQTPDWQRINWSYAHTVQVIDDSLNKVVRVIAPLDGATAPTHELTWEYSAGTSFAEVKYSLNNRSGFNAASMAIVQNPAKNDRLEMWYGATTANPVIRRNESTDPTPYRDIAAAIDAQYETCPLPSSGSELNAHYGGFLRLLGAGTAVLTFYSLDRALSVTPPPLTLSTAPGKDEQAFFYMIAEKGRWKITNGNAVDSYFVLSRIVHHFKPFAAHR